MRDSKNMGSGGGSNQGRTRDFDEQGHHRNSSRNIGSSSMGSSSGHRDRSPSGRTSGPSSGRSDRDSSRDRGSREDEDISE